MTPLRQARQGHAYLHHGVKVIAMASGERVLVRAIDPGTPWLGPAYQVLASELERLPMAYFHGETPA